MRLELQKIRTPNQTDGFQNHLKLMANSDHSAAQGDTSQRERAQINKEPPDILITTPESLYLMLTSQAESVLSGVETVIVDD